jgi:hypothetical protein
MPNERFFVVIERRCVLRHGVLMAMFWTGSSWSSDVSRAKRLYGRDEWREEILTHRFHCGTKVFWWREVPGSAPEAVPPVAEAPLEVL